MLSLIPAGAEAHGKNGRRSLSKIRIKASDLFLPGKHTLPKSMSLSRGRKDLWLNQTHVIWFKSRRRKTLVARSVRHREFAGYQVHFVGTDRNLAQPRTKCFLVGVVPRLVIVDTVTGDPDGRGDKIVRHKLAELFEVRAVRHSGLSFRVSERV
jgi:hypothetical protein